MSEVCLVWHVLFGSYLASQNSSRLPSARGLYTSSKSLASSFPSGGLASLYVENSLLLNTCKNPVSSVCCEVIMSSVFCDDIKTKKLAMFSAKIQTSRSMCTCQISQVLSVHLEKVNTFYPFSAKYRFISDSADACVSRILRARSLYYFIS